MKLRGFVLLINFKIKKTSYSLQDFGRKILAEKRWTDLCHGIENDECDIFYEDDEEQVELESAVDENVRYDLTD